MLAATKCPPVPSLAFTQTSAELRFGVLHNAQADESLLATGIPPLVNGWPTGSLVSRLRWAAQLGGVGEDPAPPHSSCIKLHHFHHSPPASSGRPKTTCSRTSMGRQDA